jgi:agmatinase
MLNKNVQTFLACEHEYAESRVVLFGAPFDSTTSFRPGTRFASRAMREDSYGLETYSPYQDLDLEDAKVFDGGDLDLCFGDTKKSLAMIHDFAAAIFQDGKLPFMIGGEHLVSLGTVQAAAEKYPDLCIVHFDAHTDLREEYLGTPLSHATVLRRIWDIVGDRRIYQFGIRSGERAEFAWAKKHTVLHPFDLQTLAENLAGLRGKPIYFTIDLDVLDPSVFPGTGTPEAGGVSIRELREAAVWVGRNLKIVGCDLVELSPHYDASGASTAMALHIWRELLLSLERDFMVRPAQL